ncbi:MAG TPA: sulfatase-like hydrolase/transferase [Tepidisphaeraceae bacterium]|nr:sulfatase-like hydrolase/transferase [Tepidisphaeraceae bacterium]
MHLHTAVLILLVALVSANAAAAEPPPSPARPNIVVILAHDLGYGDLGCFDQKRLRTPNLDAMAAEGIRFTQFYAGAPVDAPSRCVLLTGVHGGRAAVRTASDKSIAIPRGTPTVGTVLKAAGYKTAWAGTPRDFANATDLGFDVAAPAPAPDGALAFLRDAHKSPFFLLVALGAPHAKEEPAQDLGELAKTDWPAAEQAYAAAIRTLDRDAGRVLTLLKELGADRNTLVIFTSVNGPQADGGHDPEFFDSNWKFRGGKGEIFEGGIRVPMIARWPGVIPAGGQNDRQWYAGDLMATAAELAGVKPPDGLDSDSLVAALKGHVEKDQWKRKSPLYWECYEGKTAQAVRFGKWKAIRSPMITGEVELYDMSNDFGEKRDYAKRRADLTRHATNLLNKHHHPDPNRAPPASPLTPAGQGAPR